MLSIPPGDTYTVGIGNDIASDLPNYIQYVRSDSSEWTAKQYRDRLHTKVFKCHKWRIKLEPDPSTEVRPMQLNLRAGTRYFPVKWAALIEVHCTFTHEHAN
uniref:Uncharacterized protein n=1 Tax=Spongospora subterranea TaxID=70186 RepID=A0A0H5RC52_9EUKA|eukprot:CRZ11187.1 hypothetical protein [Spongospora subterranea]